MERRRTPPLASCSRLLGLLVLLASCGGGGSDPAPRDPLPRLPAGTHVGVVYADEGGPAKPALDEALGRALAAGVNAHQLSVSWESLEAVPGSIDVAPLVVWLDVLESVGLVPYLVIPTIDTNNLNLPHDLVDAEDPRALADGRAFDDPEIVERFGRVLDRVVPALLAHGGFFLSVGNEVDVHLAERGGGAAYVRFVDAARRRIHALAPDLAVGATVTYDGLRRDPALAQALFDVSDAVSMTWYPVDFATGVRDPSDASRDLDAMLLAAGEKPLLLQEAGYPAGGEPLSVLGSSAERQHRFVENLFAALPTRPRIRFVSFFALNDFSPPLVEELLEYYGFHDPRFAEFLATLGLHRADGTARPGVEAFLDGVRALRGRQRPRCERLSGRPHVAGDPRADSHRPTHGACRRPCRTGRPGNGLRQAGDRSG